MLLQSVLTLVGHGVGPLLAGEKIKVSYSSFLSEILSQICQASVSAGAMSERSSPRATKAVGRAYAVLTGIPRGRSVLAAPHKSHKSHKTGVLESSTYIPECYVPLHSQSSALPRALRVLRHGAPAQCRRTGEAIPKVPTATKVDLG